MLRGGCVCACVCALAMSARASQAQAAGSASASGRVVDAADGHPLASVELRLVGRDTVVVRSDSDGKWIVRRISPGSYTVQARLLGYAARSLHMDVGASATDELVVSLDAAPLALDQMVVTAARREQRLKDAVTTTELVTRQDIERSGAPDIAAVLLEQTGIELQGGHPAGTGVMLQGIGSERVLVLIDGQPVSGRISGVFDISRIPVTMIERVEVLRGPQSTLYGTEAMGGVVNIITREAPRGEGALYGLGVRGTVGTQSRADGSANLSFSNGAFGSSLDLSRRQIELTPGMSETAGAFTARSDLAAKVGWSRDSGLALEASVLGLDERQRWLIAPLYNFGDNKQWSGKLSARTYLGESTKHRLSATVSGSYFDHVQRASTETRPIAGDPGDRQIQRVEQLDLVYNGALGHGVALDAGTQIRRDAAETERVLGGLRSITLFEPYAQVEFAPAPGLSVVPGVRVTNSSTWGTHVTPHLAARQRLGEHLVLRGSFGTGFRAPDFKELYMRFVNSSAGYAVNGSPDLKPESSRNFMAGAEWQGNRVYGRVQAYRNDFTDFIEAVPVGPPTGQPVYEYGNVDDGMTSGLDLETGVALRGYRLEASVSAMSTQDKATGKELLGRPPASGHLTLGLPALLGVRFGITGTFTGRTPMARDEESGEINSWRNQFRRFDFRMARRVNLLSGGPEFVVGIDNIFDERPAQWAGFNGRQVYTSLSWNLLQSR